MAQRGVARAQVSLEMLVVYSAMLLAVMVAAVVIIHFGFLAPSPAPSACAAAPSFSCTATIESNGVLLVLLSQSTGATLNVIGAACASAPSGTGIGPNYGNLHVLPYSVAQSFYPDASLANGIMIYSDGSALVSVYCYNGGGIVAGAPGGTFLGYLWLNYSYADLPGNTVEQVAALSLEYT